MKNLHTFNELPAEHYKSLFALENSYWWHVSRIKWVKYIVSKFFHTTQKLSVLDFGCGTGGGLEQLKKIFNFKDAVGVDASEMAIRFAKTYSKDYHLISHNSYKMESQFDIIFLMDVLEHIDDDEKFLNELKKNLKDDGVIILSVPGLQTLFSDWDRQLGHFRRYNERNLVDLANNTNLMVEFTSYGFSLITPVVFWKRKIMGGLWNICKCISMDHEKSF